MPAASHAASLSRTPGLASACGRFRRTPALRGAQIGKWIACRRCAIRAPRQPDQRRKTGQPRIVRLDHEQQPRTCLVDHGQPADHAGDDDVAPLPLDGQAVAQPPFGPRGRIAEPCIAGRERTQQPSEHGGLARTLATHAPHAQPRTASEHGHTDRPCERTRQRRLPLQYDHAERERDPPHAHRPSSSTRRRHRACSASGLRLCG